MDGSHIGRFGTLSVMKTSEPTVPIAHFPIDEEEITVGRDPSCSIRLYYETVSRLHCKITFQERKAFLIVLGASGLTADGCMIFPTAFGPTTVPLGNESEIEVHRKIFRFTYPPKQLRAVLLSTPEPDRTRRRKTLRMSMIQCAQVFSPGPSPDPQENLRTLQSPLKPRFPSPLKSAINAPVIEEEEEEDDIVLVDGNNPSVVQDDDDDLVILENVQAPPTPVKSPEHLTQLSQQQYQTPNRKPRSSLHRTVLIRSAHRVARKIELETEEAQEEKEVEEVFAALEDEAVVQEFEEEDNETLENQDQMLEDVPEEDAHRQLGPFMTPQATSRRSAHTGRTRLGYSVEGPRRVRVVQPWKVRDIVIAADSRVKQEEFAPVFRKEKISDAERMAIRERRNSAWKVPDPSDTQIPGSRRTSSIAPPPTVFFLPKEGGLSVDIEGFKADVHEEEDTAVLFKKMKAMVEDMKRRKSIGGSLSPVKGDAEAAFWGSGARNYEMAEDGRDSQYKHDMARPEGGEPTAVTSAQSEDLELDLDKSEEELQTSVHEVSSQALPTKTPRMEGMKHMFVEPREPSTPAFGGMKGLFVRDQLATPAYAGVKAMFLVREEESTPAFEGVEEMLATPAGFRVDTDRDTVDVPVDVDEDEQIGSEELKGAVIHKRKGAQKRMQSVSPDPAEPRKILRNTKPPSKATVSVPRLVRARKGVTEGRGATSKPVSQSEPPRKTKSVDIKVDEENTGTARRTTRKTPTAGASASMFKIQAARQTRARTAPTTTLESDLEDEGAKMTKSQSTIARRGTRGKPLVIKESVEGEEQSVPVPAKVKRSGRGKQAETIKEEEELLVPEVPTTKGHSSARSRTHKTTDNPVAKDGKENTPDLQQDDDEDDESIGTTVPQPSAPSKVTRPRRGAVKATAVKDEPKQTNAMPRTRVTRSRK